MRPLAALLLIIFIASGCAHVGGPSRPALTVDEELELATVYERKGEVDLALRHYREALSRDGSNAAIHFAIGNLYLRIGDFEGAERSYLSAISLDPAEGAYFNNLGWLYMETGRLEKAEAMAREAVKRESTSRFAYLDTLGVILARSGKYAEAEEALIEATALLPEGEREAGKKVYGHLLDLYGKTGEIEKAAEIERFLRDGL